MSKSSGSLRRYLKRMFGLALLALLVVVSLNGFVCSAGTGRTYSTVDDVPRKDVALVLGTSPKFEGRKNLYFESRMMAAATLYKAGKVRVILASGDNGTKYYDEPAAMKESLMKKGVPEGAIVLDNAGFRTLDSIVRAHRVFGLKDCVIVTDDFHLPRALFFANDEGLDAVGFQGEHLPFTLSPRTHVREVGARVIAVIDAYVLETRPKFLGDPIKIDVGR